MGNSILDEPDTDREPDELITLGWREWLRLPDLGIDRIKAKVDTGARTSALHAFKASTYESDGVEYVEFHIHPLQRNDRKVIVSHAPIADRRVVSDSGGHKEERIVIVSPIQIGPYQWPIELTLTTRDSMRFRMLLGRTAITGRAVVDCAQSYLVGTRIPGKKARVE